MKRTALVLIATLLCLTGTSLSAAEADNATTVGKLELYPNFQTMSIYAYYSGDANGNSDVKMEYRKAGDKEWHEGHHLTRIGADLWTGSVFWLTPNAKYDVRVTFADPDGAKGEALAGSVSTRNDRWPTGSGKTIHVAAGGAGDGSKESPVGSIQKAVDAAEPGDTVLVAPGTYRESVVVKKSGRADAYILIKGEPGATLDGSAAEFDDRGQYRWQNYRNQRARENAYDFVADCD